LILPHSIPNRPYAFNLHANVAGEAAITAAGSPRMQAVASNAPTAMNAGVKIIPINNGTFHSPSTLLATSR
jgi:hypothetical protein